MGGDGTLLHASSLFQVSLSLNYFPAMDFQGQLNGQNFLFLEIQFKPAMRLVTW